MNTHRQNNSQPDGRLLDRVGLTPSGVARLYAAAERLALQWIGAGLADDFDSRMVEATLRCLTRVGRQREDGSRRSAAEQEQFALAMLRRIWARNARRDAARYLERDVRVVPFDDLHEGAALTELWSALGDDLLAGETGRDVARFLETERRWPRERAWAFVLVYSARSYEEASDLLAHRFERVVTPATLRQWKRRHFEGVASLVAAFLTGEHTLTAP